MSVKIKSVEHCVYKNTFLDEVCLKVFLDSPLSSKLDSFTAFLDSEFHYRLTEDTAQSLEFNSLRLQQNGQMVEFRFANDFFTLTIGQDSYTSFSDSLLPRALPVLDFLIEKFGIRRISIKKINSWIFLTGPSLTLESALERILSDEFRSTLPALPKMKEMMRNVLTRDEEPFKLFFGILPEPIEKEGWLRRHPDKTQGNPTRFVLVTEAGCDDAASLVEGNVKELLGRMNTALFDLYHWMVSGFIIHVMQSDIKG